MRRNGAFRIGQRQQWALGALCAVVCAHLAETQVLLPTNFDLDRFANFSVDRPFQFRIFTAAVLRLFDRALAPHLGGLVAPLTPPFNHPVVIFKFATCFVSFVLASWFSYRTAKLISNERWSAWLTVFVLLYMTYFDVAVVHPAQFYLPYDAPSLAFFAACIWAAASNRLIVFAAVFVVAMTNRETALLYLMPLGAIGLTRPAGEMRKVAMTVIVCAIVWLAYDLAIPRFFRRSRAMCLRCVCITASRRS